MNRKTRKIKIKDIFIGGDSSIKIQSMTNTKTLDVEKTIKQINDLEYSGCEIVRIAVPNMDSAKVISSIKKRINIPIVADIHFDHKLAIESIKQGIDKLRINPGNIGGEEKVKELVNLAKKKNIPIRIGVNAGSLDKEIMDKFGGINENSMVESALKHIDILERNDFYNTIISLKANDIHLTKNAYKLMASKKDYPLHLGITEAGSLFSGSIRSAVGIGSILSDGIGDTIRVSLTGDPVEEIRVAKEILKSLNLYKDSVHIISCPTCGRCSIDLIELATKVENAISNIRKDIKVAIMGCGVNGPGEAREADIGIAGGNNSALLFKKGEIIRKLKEEEIVETLLEEIEKL